MLTSWFSAIKFFGSMALAVFCALVFVGGLATLSNIKSWKDILLGIIMILIGFAGFCFFTSLVVPI